MIRVKLSKDSLCYVNHLQKNYIIISTDNIEKELKTTLSFLDILEIITAKPKIMNDAYILVEDEMFYNLQSERAKYFFDYYKNKIILSSIIYNNKESLKIFFKNYNDIGNYFLPKKLIISTNQFFCSLEYNNIILNKPQKVHFKIPEKYVEL